VLALQEEDLLSQIDSAYIVKYYDSFISPTENINIVMEYCAHGDLYHFLSRRKGRFLGENIVWKLLI
jgi:serine/threonine protein kinase